MNTLIALTVGVTGYTIYYYVKKWKDSKKSKYVRKVTGASEIHRRPTPPPNVSQSELFKAEYPDQLGSADEVVSILKTINNLSRDEYFGQNLDKARMIYDFSEPYPIEGAPYRGDRAVPSKHGVLWNVNLPEAEISDSYQANQIGMELYNDLVARGIIEGDSNHRLVLSVGTGNDNVYLLVYSAPKKLDTGKRRPFGVRDLLYIISLNAPFHPDTETPDRRFAYNLSDLGISQPDKDFLARILSAEMDRWNPTGACHSRHQADALLCDLERLSVLQVAMNRLQTYKDRHGGADYDALRRRWNNSSTFENFYRNAESKGYQSNREFIDRALYLPHIISASSFIHPWGYSSRPDQEYARWIRHSSDGGTLSKYPLRVGFGVFAQS